MEVQATQNTIEEAVDDIGAQAATDNAERKKKSDVVTIPKKTAQAVTSAAETDLISDLVHEIKSLEKSDAIARLIELEDANEQTYFEIGGLLSVMQKEKWFDPFASLDEWVENKTAMKRSKARALIQIYNAIVESGVAWAQVQDIGWTKLRAIARVLDEESAHHWIGVASNHSKKEIIELVKQHLSASGGAVAGSPTATRVRSFKLHEDQAETVNAAIEKMKKSSNTPDDSAALAAICLDYVGGPTLQQRLVGLEPDVVAKTFSDVLNNLDRETALTILHSIVENPTSIEMVREALANTAMEQIKGVLSQCSAGGFSAGGWLGVHIKPVNDTIADSLGLGTARGALIAGVDDKGPANPAGLKPRDVIVKFDGKAIKESRDLSRLVASMPVGKSVEVVVVRDGKEVTKTVTLGRLEDGEKQTEVANNEDEA